MVTNLIMEEIYRSSSQVKERIENAFRYTAISIKLINSSTTKDYDISDVTKISINLDANHDDVKSEYISWIIGNCLTYMFEIFTCHLDALIKILNTEFPSDQIVLKSKFDKCEEKLKKINKKIGEKYLNKVPLRTISDEEIDAIKTIREARNCLVHKDGIVDDIIAKPENNSLFELKYYYIKDYFVLIDGSKTELSDYTGPKEDIKTIWSGLGLYSISFKIKEHINITPQELFRIGIFFNHLIGVLSGDLRLLFNYDYPNNIIIV